MWQAATIELIRGTTLGLLEARNSEKWLQGARTQTLWKGGTAWLLLPFRSLEEEPWRTQFQSRKEEMLPGTL